MLFIAMQRYIKPRAAALRACVTEHLAWNFKLQQEGRILFSGPIRDPEFILTDVRQAPTDPDDREIIALMILRADSLEEAQELMATDPFVRHGHRVCDVFEWELRQAFGIGPFTPESLGRLTAEREQLGR